MLASGDTYLIEEIVVCINIGSFRFVQYFHSKLITHETVKQFPRLKTDRESSRWVANALFCVKNIL